MFRALIAAAGIALVFGGTVAVAGDKLGAWDSPPPRPKTSAAASTPSTAKSPAKRSLRTPAGEPWIAKLDALCRSAETAVAAIPEPQTTAEAPRYFQQIDKLSRNWNRLATAQLALAARSYPAEVRRLRELFADERRLITGVIASAKRQDVTRLQLLAPRLVSNGMEQSRLMVGLGASGCALTTERLAS
jgi:hypothetical protein